MTPLSRAQARYLLIGHGLVPVVINFVLNGLIGWAMFRGAASVPLWAREPSVGGDTLGTCFFLPAITCLIVTPIVRLHTSRGVVAPLEGAGALPVWLRSFYRPLLRRAGRLGLAGLLIAGPLAALGLLLPGGSSIELASFLWLKASFAALLGGLVTPLIGLLALADRAPQPQPESPIESLP
ncbi:MAG: hypothetical protein ACE5FG_14395 [Myxococcota bacterium]